MGTMTLDKPLRILHLIMTYREVHSAGGVETFLMNVYRKLDRQKLQFDFATTAATTFGIFCDEIHSMGGKIFELKIYGNTLKSRFKSFFALRRFLKQNRYTVIHIHSTAPTWQIVGLLAAACAGVPARIAHSHSDPVVSSAKRILFGVLRPLVCRLAAERFACSEPAAIHLFGEKAFRSGKVRIIRNGIDIAKFSFNGKVRALCRKELGLGDAFVIGHVGRFVKAKNHVFLLEVFQELLKICPKSILLLIGDGELRGAVEQKARDLGMEESVRFLGERRDVDALYQAMDVFVLPSLDEGLGNVLIEAQAAGLLAICSDCVPKEAGVTGLLEFVPLEAGARRWAESIAKYINMHGRPKMDDKIEQAGYGSEYAAKLLEAVYAEKI